MVWCWFIRAKCAKRREQRWDERIYMFLLFCFSFFSMWWLSRCIHTNWDGIMNRFTRITSYQQKSSSDRFSVYSCRFRKIHVYAWKGKNQQNHPHAHTPREANEECDQQSHSHTHEEEKNKKKWNKARWNKSKCHRHCKSGYFAEWTRWFIVDFRFFFCFLLLVYSVWMRV